MNEWRVGRKLGRTLYEQTEDNPGERFVGMMETADLARTVVDAVNHWQTCRSVKPVNPGTPIVPVYSKRGVDVIPQDHGPVLPPPAQTDLPVVPLDPLGDHPGPGNS